jgi:hypothetical protein
VGSCDRIGEPALQCSPSVGPEQVTREIVTEVTMAPATASEVVADSIATGPQESARCRQGGSPGRPVTATMEEVSRDSAH